MTGWKISRNSFIRRTLIKDLGLVSLVKCLLVYSLFTNDMQRFFFGNIFVNMCHSHMGFLSLVLESSQRFSAVQSQRGAATTASINLNNRSKK